MTSPVQRYRLLGGHTRSRLLSLLRQSAQPLTVTDLATMLERHPNTVREQLDKLIDAGLVTGTTQRRAAGRGRPRRCYAATHGVDEPDERAYAGLARALADQLAQVPNARAAAIDAGQRWGRELVAAGPVPDGETEARGQLVDLLGQLGFEPDQPAQGSERIGLHNCPFGSLARERGDIVCGVHLGLMRGALEGLAAPLEAVALEPFVRSDLCVAQLGLRADG